MHYVKMGTEIMREKISYVLPEYRDILPPLNPPGAEDDTPLHECYNWVMPWPKSQIRLGGAGGLEAKASHRRHLGPPAHAHPALDESAPKEPAVAAATTT